MLEDLRCTNIADSDASLLEELSMESILAADPDYIFLVLQGRQPGEGTADFGKSRALKPPPGSSSPR